MIILFFFKSLTLNIFIRLIYYVESNQSQFKIRTDIIYHFTWCKHCLQCIENNFILLLNDTEIKNMKKLKTPFYSDMLMTWRLIKKMYLLMFWYCKVNIIIKIVLFALNKNKDIYMFLNIKHIFLIWMLQNLHLHKMFNVCNKTKQKNLSLF